MPNFTFAQVLVAMRAHVYKAARLNEIHQRVSNKCETICPKIRWAPVLFSFVRGFEWRPCCFAFNRSVGFKGSLRAIPIRARGRHCRRRPRLLARGSKGQMLRIITSLQNMLFFLCEVAVTFLLACVHYANCPFASVKVHEFTNASQHVCV